MREIRAVVLATWVAISTAASACGARATAKATDPLPKEDGTVTRFDSMARPPLIVIDTDEDIWPDPRQRTYVRLEALRSIITWFRSDSGRYPSDLDELFRDDPPRGVRFTTDAWDSRFRYLREDQVYRLVSSGPDRVFGTSDDIDFGPDTEVPEFRRTPERRTAGVLATLWLAVTAHHRHYGDLPLSLEAVAEGEAAALLTRVVDGWESPILYRRMGESFELRSAGPDGELHTADDHWVAGFNPVVHRPEQTNP